ncbi:hypothetical protein JCM10213_006497 [Rhodosporidiobolus nylandii]
MASLVRRVDVLRPEDLPMHPSAKCFSDVAAVVSACPNLTHLTTCFQSDLGPSGWLLHAALDASVLSRLTSYTLFFVGTDGIYRPGNRQYCYLTAERIADHILPCLEPRNLTRLNLLAPSSRFGESFESFMRYLLPFHHLTHRRLEGCHTFSDFSLLHLSDLKAPLRSIHLNLGRPRVAAHSIFLYLHTYRSTLAHLILTCWIVDRPPAPLHLPELRHLRLSTPNPHLLLPSIVAPLQLLDLPELALAGEEPVIADYYPFVRALSSTLRIFSAPQSLSDFLPHGGIDAVVTECKANGILVLWRSKKATVEDDMEEIDRWAGEWGQDKGEARFLKGQYMEGKGFTAEYV